jgi:transposase-like protein
MILGIVVIVVVLVLIVLAIVFALERKRCPSCSKRAVALKFWESSRRNDVHVAHFTCRRCRAEWRSYDGKNLIAREAFEAGAREPIPHAVVRPKAQR